jgi:hypothetical protein
MIGARGGSPTGQSSKDRVTVASEKADFIADRIAAGVPAPEEEVRRLARYLRDVAAEMKPSVKKRPGAAAAGPASRRPEDGDAGPTS